MRIIEIAPTTRQAIDLDGIYGTFRIRDCAFAIHYFSTFATPSPQENEEHYRKLLEELRPMRERVSAKDLTDLNALLQRDLSDERIARELVPYLCGEVSKVGFFPPVLAVLVPSGFIDVKSGGTNDYPLPVPTSDGIAYGKLWQLRYHAGSKRLARLSIYGGTEVIVLDGQHRSNAFRYVSEVLKPSNLYAVFYEHAPKGTGFSSDLPVTIAWFEPVGPHQVKPNDISRELFVAVNNSAKTVSESRTILLDDSDPASLAVNTYYSVLARKRGFKTGGMNLMCACFDVDLDETMANYRPVFALTDPIALRSAVTYGFFALDRYDSLERSKANRQPQTNKARFERLFGSVSYIDTGGGRRIQPIVDLSNRVDYRGKIEKSFVPILEALFEKSTIAACHHKAVQKAENQIQRHGTTAQIDTWDKIFCGGEGLFGQIQKSESAKAVPYQKAIREIQELFRNERREVVREAIGKALKLQDEQIEKAFKLFDTVAFQTGVVMALSIINKDLHRKKVSASARLKRACEKIENVSLTDWFLFFCSFDQLYFRNLEANVWPRFQKLFVRLFYKECDAFKKNPTWSPDFEMVEKRSIEIVTGLAEGGQAVKTADVEKSVDRAIAEVKAGFATLNEKLICKPAVIKKIALQAARSELAKILKRRREAASSALAEGGTAEADDESDQI